jgi:hypothetical protein
MTLVSVVGSTWVLRAQAQDEMSSATPTKSGASDGGASTNAVTAADAPVSSSGWRSVFSSKYGDFRWYTTLTAQVRYDDNILQTDRDRISDFIGMISPGLNFEYAPVQSESQTLLHLDYAPQFVGYLAHSEFDAIDHQAHLQLSQQFGRLQVGLNHSLLITTEPEIEETARGTLQDEDTQLPVNYQLSDKSALTFTPFQDWTTVDGGVTVWEYGGSLEDNYQFTSKLNLLATYSASEITASPGIDGFKQSLLGGAAWQMTDLSQLNFQCGFENILYDGNSKTSPDVSLNWTYQMGPKTVLQLNVSYESDFSKYVAFQLNQTLESQAILAYSLTPKIGLQLRGSTELLHQDSVATDVESGGDLGYWAAGCGVVYHYNLSTDIELDFDHQHRGSNQFYDSFNRNVVQLQVQYHF